MYNLYKRAGAFGDNVRGTLGDIAGGILLPRLTHNQAGYFNAVKPVEQLGALKALLDDSTIEDVKSMHDNKYNAYIPGISSYRNIAKAKAVENKLSKRKDKNKHLSEILGQYTSSALLGGVGAGVGFAHGGKLTTSLIESLMGKKFADKGLLKKLVSAGGRVTGAAGGGALGLGAGAGMNLLGLLAAQITPGRSEKSQSNYYNRTSLGNYIIPGLAAYNRAKSIGVADRMAKALSRVDKALKK